MSSCRTQTARLLIKRAKHSSVIILLVLFTFLLNATALFAAQPLRVVTYNIAAGCGENKGFFTRTLPHGTGALKKVARALKEMDADIIALNEADFKNYRSLWTDQPKYIAKECGMQYSCKAAGQSFSVFFNSGNAILSKHPIVSHTAHKLYKKDDMQRVCLEAKVDVNGTMVTVLNVHLSTTEEERLKQIEEVKRIAAAVSGPVVLLGDFNAIPSSRVIESLLKPGQDKEFRDSNIVVNGPDAANNRRTVPAWEPKDDDVILGWSGTGNEKQACIDYIFTSNDIGVEDNYTLNNATRKTSDHLPVVANLVIPDADGGVESYDRAKARAARKQKLLARLHELQVRLDKLERRIDRLGTKRKKLSWWRVISKFTNDRKLKKLKKRLALLKLQRDILAERLDKENLEGEVPGAVPSNVVLPAPEPSGTGSRLGH